jgi:hypothetical protein
MEQARLIRVILPAFVLMGSMLLGAWLAHPSRVVSFFEADKSVAAIGAIAAAAVVPLGFAIGGVTNALLWVWHRGTPESWDRFELRLPQYAWHRISAAARLDAEANVRKKDDRVWIASLWIRTCVPKEIRELVDRRYHNAFAHLNAAVAIWLSYAIGICLLGIPSGVWRWYLWTTPLALGFLPLALLMRGEASRIVEIASGTFNKPLPVGDR